LIASRDQPWPLDEFRARAGAAFGEAPSFHTCQRGGFSLDELLAFLSAKGKVSLGLETIALGPVEACDH
jgi:probable metal-binding protein